MDRIDPDRIDMDAFLALFEGQLDEGDNGSFFIDENGITAADLVDRNTRDVLPPTKKKSTQPNQRRRLAWWKTEIGVCTLVDCTPALIAETRDMRWSRSTRRAWRPG